MAEMVIGTDDVLPDVSLPPIQYTPPTDDDVSIILTTIAGLHYNGGNAIEGYDLDVIHAVRDRLDQLYYWAVEEKHFRDSSPPLVLANERLVALLVKLIETNRPKIIVSVFRALRELLLHPARVPNYSDFLPLLCKSLQQFPNMEDLVEEGVATIAAMATVNPEAILVSDGVSAVLQAMQKAPNLLPVHRFGCLLFAALVDGKRPDPTEAPAALLLVHIGVVVDFMCRAYQRQTQDTAVSAAVAHTLAVMASIPQNHEELVSHRLVLSTLRHLAEHHHFTTRTVQDALTAVSELCGELDRLQQRTIALSIKELMMRTTETETLATCVAVVLKLLRNGGEEMQHFVVENQVPQVIAIALDHFGEDDDVLRDICMTALREMVISKLR
ncbi:acyl-CoA dehydrogenase, putative [Bodo saltans]|uniref:Acyl-CoA dehydrogenase, putative n=1 Tax=Bodo saltans TaxID=75058 RepID=A0A0S4IXJ4_BODSA|nr:acyl-CoA dehydrogenase, putative [Bodo saltans]|eukprot:CUG07501.1 acyl-CoA dehydrogenase, putative [Bodo saltans]